MKKPYQGHEVAYRRMRRKGIRSWGEREEVSDPAKRREMDPDDERFLLDVLAQPWAPQGGKAVELGCGTAPMLRWVCWRGFRGLGIDVSRTAIAMARGQSKGLDVRFQRADCCGSLPGRPGAFDLVMDGHCLHCIVRPEDRAAFLGNARRILKRDGLFVVLTMCGPVDRKAFSRLLPHQHLLNRIVYVACDAAADYEGSRVIKGRTCMPTRYIGHWKRLLAKLRGSGFHVRLLRYQGPTADDPFGSLAVAAAVGREM